MIYIIELTVMHYVCTLYTHEQKYSIIIYNTHNTQYNTECRQISAGSNTHCSINTLYIDNVDIQTCNGLLCISNHLQ